MNFLTLKFLIFFLSTYFIFLKAWPKWRVPFLMIVSFVFYASSSLNYFFLLLLLSIVNYLLGRLLFNASTGRRQILALSIALNLVVLIFFKYLAFFLNIVSFTFLPSLSLPLGISFFTFEAISYQVDIYRGKPAAPTWLSYFLYIFYFPHLISGPIIRFNELYLQTRKKLSLPSYKRLRRGLVLIALGFAYKALIADSLTPLVDPVFKNPDQFNWLSIITAIFAFGNQIYFDFLGYTEIARGLSLLFNITLPLNFDFPYRSQSITEFWRRWHISLSAWIRDYLYIPLGGSRSGKARTYFNLIAVMTIVGFWHGANWNFIFWGLYHGLLLVIERRFPAKSHLFSRFWPFIRTYLLVNFGWLIFRSNSLASFLNMLHGLVDLQLSALSVSSMFVLLLLVSLSFGQKYFLAGLSHLFKPFPDYAKVMLGMMIVIIWLLLQTDVVKPFIYFNF
ncbi:hypothetical protein A2313_00680 [Candidatus Roizmanbacteria bacterium RIFOXYB2_FULL_41_10]|uniref:Alginate O-acetyltransferase n=1 Tax=Candidatus Roizmanbacteria bacterium RIFOXYA1_FULL_41_12 TaxID=1802082 RepID=A0A1F7KAF7_9BACT|nr:MAG: hypothetical protein A2209_04040 [Candidatus Roizmanbacteria bacterium RIFOXYA1_FULL_41_12]OGK66895.1 MAG: hypothetical protein A2377_03285 [Candidatus Roizmanbacteria bacterium RIFOXYB1_FULL_41_27]OGK70731.1 MAG: hypothetical protein A2403_01420 [Candidatus Roizmanbacteria bacterium RIFOXYC1_FULL_41_16]OGK71476.1 MAG: hypothetical protein A2313_00680 [Candidatus Roizmanbacteria bacterium RIFOXYB2_FULL_41_10]OGK75429.1 MAG: hypothetical protein A2459_01095 [Candidatus Roizmanbacteria ba